MIRLILAAPAVAMMVYSSPAWSQALPIPVEYPGVTYPTLPDGSRLTQIVPGQAANGARFSGGAISEIGTLRISTIRPPVGVPGLFTVRGGGSRALARGLMGVNPYVIAAGLAAWLAYEGIQKCQNSGGAYFWCINRTKEFIGWKFYSVVNPNKYFATPQQAFDWAVSVTDTRSDYTYSYQPCRMRADMSRWTCHKTSKNRWGDTVVDIDVDIYGTQDPAYNTTSVPATQEDFDRVADTHPLVAPDLAPGQAVEPNADELLNASPVPVPVERPAVQPGFIPASESPLPYPCAAFASGSCLDGWRMAPSPTPDCPNCVRVTPVTVDPTNPDAVKPPTAGTATQPDQAASAAAGTAPDKDRDPCELDPSRLGCLKLGEDEGKPVPKQSKAVSYTAESVGLPAGCPADAPGPSGKPPISYASACEAASYARPVVVALGAMAALMIVIAAVRS